MQLPATVRATLDDLRSWLDGRFGERVVRVALFGSFARGEAHEESDVDVLVVVDGLTSAEGREVGQYTGDLLTQHGVLLSTFTLSTQRWAELVRLERRIARDIERDAVPL